MNDTAKRTLRVGITVGALAGLIGCSDHDMDDFSMTQSEIESENGLAMNGLAMNGLAMNGLAMNGLAMNGLAMNGLAMNGLAMNGLAVAGGLSSTSGLMTTPGGRDIVKYMVKCALPTGHTLTKQDQNGVSYDFPGMLGVAPEWETNSCGTDCQERVSACMLAHVNNSGQHISIWLDGPDTGIGWGSSTNYPYQEGAFFGNLFPNPWQGYYCIGKDLDSGSVPGRIGPPLASNVYTNPYGGGVPCRNACTITNEGYTNCSDYSPISPYTSGHKWTHVVTVWRNFEATQMYQICTKQTPARCLGVVGNSTADGASIEQRTYSGAPGQQWQILQVETGKYKFQNVNSGMVIDVSGTQMVQHAYTGATNQKIPVVYFADQAGWANLKPGAASTGMSADSASDGVLVKMSSNLSADWAKWGFTAVGLAPSAGGTSTGTAGSTGAAGSGGSTGSAGSSGSTFTAGTAYRIAPNSSGGNVSLDLPGGVMNNGTMMQLYSSTNGNNNQRMQFIANGSNWKIVMNGNTNKCFDAGTGNGSLLVINDCNGSATQSWTLTFDGSAYQIKNAGGGRCLDIPNGSLANGTHPQIYDCSAGNNNQRYQISVGQ
jgi:hypothetical protein